MARRGPIPEKGPGRISKLASTRAGVIQGKDSPTPRSRPVENDPPTQAQIVARLLRHEFGDLLQSVYGTVSILLDRLATSAVPERVLLGDLKHRAELCRFEIDAV